MTNIEMLELIADVFDSSVKMHSYHVVTVSDNNKGFFGLVDNDKNSGITYFESRGNHSFFPRQCCAKRLLDGNFPLEFKQKVLFNLDLFC